MHENLNKTFNGFYFYSRVNIPPLSVMKDELSVAGETEGVQAVKAEIMKMFKDIVSIIKYTSNKKGMS